MKPVLFLHVPKTSGTSLKLFFKKRIDRFYVQANSRHQLAQADPFLGRVKDLDDIVRVLETHSGLALHVDSDFEAVHETSSFRSLAWLLFEPENRRVFERYTILTMLREPFSRFLSESAFIEMKQETDDTFLPDTMVTGLAAHLERTAENGALQFLLAREFSRRSTLTDRDLDQVKALIVEFPIHVGIYERYGESIRYFSRLLGHDFSEDELPSYNVVSKKPPVPAGVEQAFRERNRLDCELYDFAVETFEQRVAELAI